MPPIDIAGITANSLDIIFDVFGNLLVSGSVVQPPTGYNTVTGGFGTPEILYSVSEVMRYHYERSRIDGQIIRELDQEAVLRVSDVSVEITNSFKLRFSSDGEWDILNVKRDPSETVYFLQIRRP